MPPLDELLWRSHRAAAALLRDLECASNGAGSPLNTASDFLAIVIRHVPPLRAAIEAVEDHERADAEREGRAEDAIWGRE